MINISNKDEIRKTDDIINTKLIALDNAYDEDDDCKSIKMDKNPFEKIGGYAGIDIADILKTLQEKSEFKKPEKRTEKWDRLEKLWDEFGKLIQPDYLDDANLEGILRCMDSILAIDPKNYGALHNKGMALGDLNRKEEALACYDEVFKHGNDHIALYGKG